MFKVYGVQHCEGEYVPIIKECDSDPFCFVGENEVCNGFITKDGKVLAVISPEGVIQEV